jgi:hypothetical protein
MPVKKRTTNVPLSNRAFSLLNSISKLEYSFVLALSSTTASIKKMIKRKISTKI